MDDAAERRHRVRDLLEDSVDVGSLGDVASREHHPHARVLEIAHATEDSSEDCALA